MLGLIIVAVAAFTVRRLWPDAAAFLLIYPVLTVPLQMLASADNRARLGETVDWSAGSLLFNYLISVTISTVVFAVLYAARRRLERLKAGG
jgi:hypothetical protein